MSVVNCLRDGVRTGIVEASSFTMVGECARATDAEKDTAILSAAVGRVSSDGSCEGYVFLRNKFKLAGGTRYIPRHHERPHPSPGVQKESKPPQFGTDRRMGDALRALPPLSEELC